jgi:FMN phosphatase YigB (HAD superfamily)
MLQCIIFDLSEVLIAGLVGVEKQLARVLSTSEEEILPGFMGDVLDEFFKGGKTEDEYLDYIIAREGWAIELPRLKTFIRANFHNQIDGSLDIVQALLPRFNVVLHSDHAKEWIAYIKSIHPFIGLFKYSFFSYELGDLKNDPRAFLKILDSLALPPRDCLFVDDNLVNVGTAQSVGIRGIHFQNARQLAREFRFQEIF